MLSDVARKTIDSSLKVEDVTNETIAAAPMSTGATYDPSKLPFSPSINAMLIEGSELALKGYVSGL